MKRTMVTIDGNEAASYVAHKTNEVIAIYPITPSSPMGEWADEWSSKGIKNIWGNVPLVVEMQSEGGASAAVHGALQTGSLSTTFTASQGLLLMIPTMHKIAGELTPTVFHVSARTLASHALSIFGDHSDVMNVRTTGFALIASNSIQEVMDFALIAQMSTLKSRVPFLHFFDGFRSSHEVQKIEQLTDEDMRAMIDDTLVQEHRARALSPDHPVLRGSAQNPDHFFQARETVNPYYLACPETVQESMNHFSKIIGREYHLFDYFGDHDAKHVIVLMGSAAETAEEAADYLLKIGEKIGIVKIRLYRPFSIKDFLNALPKTVESIAALDRTKEPGSAGEPLYLDVVNSIYTGIRDGISPFAKPPRIIGGRYGLSSKEFTPAMVKAIFHELKKDQPKNRFTIGIVDDVTQSSLSYDTQFSTEGDDVFRGIFFGLGADGTVSANKNSIKIIGEETENYAQGYFVYDSRKAGSLTISHLRFGKKPIHSTYLINKANFIACHQWIFLERYDMLRFAVDGATFLVNSPYPHDEVWNKVPRKVQEDIIKKKLKFYCIDAYQVAKETGMGAMINTIMQTCFFAISNILSREEAILKIKDAIKKAYGRKGERIVQMNFNAVDIALEHLHEIQYPDKPTSSIELSSTVSDEAPPFVKDVVARIIEGRGDEIPVSAMPHDGTFETGTTQWEKRNIALDIPVWEERLCIQCGKCALVCPHAAIRSKAYDGKYLSYAPPTYKSIEYKGKEFPEGYKYTIQVAPEDCTGCALCVVYCPAHDKKDTKRKAINMMPQIPLRASERENYKFFLSLPEVDRRKVKINTVKGSQLLQPLFEYSGACAACGETPYVKLLTQLFGDRAIICNATGCSSIFGGNLPTIPYTKNADGRGPAWCNSLFEDNAEFGFGFRLTFDSQKEFAREIIRSLSNQIGENLAEEVLQADQSNEAGIHEQRERIAELKKILKKIDSRDAQFLMSIADSLVHKSVWILGGDGWAYDIGYGGLDHVLACGRDVNILVLDTEVYSNTGGQLSKSTPRAAVAKFAAAGKPLPKKDLAMIAMTYGYVYVAKVAMGANDAQCIRAFLEAESYNGPSLIIAYSHCISHGIDMAKGLEQQKKAVESGYWPLIRFDPRLIPQDLPPLKLDSKEPKIPLEDYIYKETRYKTLLQSHPEAAKNLLKLAQEDVHSRWHIYQQMAKMKYSSAKEAMEIERIIED